MSVKEVKKRNSTQGLALFLVVVYIVLISLAIAGTLMLTLNQARIFETQRDSARSTYYLNAGVEVLLWGIKGSPPPEAVEGVLIVEGEEVEYSIIPQPQNRYNVVCSYSFPDGRQKEINLEVERYALTGGGALLQVLSWQE